jgi:hypothetical protein
MKCRLKKCCEINVGPREAGCDVKWTLPSGCVRSGSVETGVSPVVTMTVV